MNKVVLQVELTFSEPVTEVAEVNEVVSNVFAALEHAVHEIGLSPENSEACTTAIAVKATSHPSKTVSGEIAPGA